LAEDHYQQFYLHYYSFFFLRNGQSQAEDTIRIGVLIDGSGEGTLKKWDAVTEHLSIDIS
jgi:hypothetical protein